MDPFLWLYVGIAALVVLLAIVLPIVITSHSGPHPPVENTESRFLRKLETVPAFNEQFLTAPKQTLQDFLSADLGHPVVLPQNMKVIPIQNDPNILYVVLPYRDSAGGQTGPPSALESMIQILNPKVTYGAFMGELEGIFWHFGITPGSCVRDIYSEIQQVKQRGTIDCG